MKRLLALGVFVAASLAPSPAQQTGPTELPGDPFVIRQTWQIGGEGNWGELAVDAAAQQLFIAHGAVVQVVDLSTGTLAGQIPVKDAEDKDDVQAGRLPVNEAHGIALDDTGQYGYVTVGGNGNLQVFDRRLLKVVASVRTSPSPRAIVSEPASHLLFVVCSPPPAATGSKSRPLNSQIPVKSRITVVDADKLIRLGDIELAGNLGAAQADSRGHVFVNVIDSIQIVSFDAQAVADALRQQPHPEKPALPSLDWTNSTRASMSADPHPTYFGAGCIRPSGLAIDSAHDRLFVACTSNKLAILNSASGAVIATLDLRPGSDAVEYDSSHGLIFTANGGELGDLGSLSIIRQDVTDTYAAIQTLATRQRAHTLAVNPSTGEVYLITEIIGFDLTKKGEVRKPGTLPVIDASPVKGSFQVLVVSH